MAMVLHELLHWQAWHLVLKCQTSGCKKLTTIVQHVLPLTWQLHQTEQAEMNAMQAPACSQQVAQTDLH
jgi:hypothetical protein